MSATSTVIKSRHDDNQQVLNELRNTDYIHYFDGWYFCTREQIEFGPYPTLDAVKQAREHFTSKLLDECASKAIDYSPSLLFLETVELSA